MTESMIVEAVRNVTATNSPMNTVAATGPNAVSATADPSAVARFNAVMETAPVPFADEMSAVWRSAQTNNQGFLHRIRTLSELTHQGGVATGELLELQYEVMNLSFQQEIVTKVADKSSNAIQTLVKNQ